MRIKKIATTLDAFQLYTLFKDESYSFILESGMDYDQLGRYSFIGSNPFLLFSSKEQDISIWQNGTTTHFEGDPLEAFRDVLSRYRMNYRSDLPFIGGAVGYLGYDLCHHIEDLPRAAIDDQDLPDCHFGIYDGVIIVDHLKGETYIASLGIAGNVNQTIERIEQIITNGQNSGLSINIPKRERPVKPESNFTKPDYITAVNRIKEYIRSGDVYQVNMTQRFTCEMERTPYELYAKLRKLNPAPFAGFIDFGVGHIVSSSPERFIRIQGRTIETRPIKGTRPRGMTPEEDRANREELLSSEKDKAELLMIVDLERNDLGRISKKGSVNVTELFHLEEYATVYHLVSTIVGELRDDCDVVDCLKATFPGGSITGAPKIRAMEIIDELEPTQRNIYTGAIGYIGLNGDMDLNIAIRTIVCKDDRAYFQVGGGIVWDSDAESEYQETLHKAKSLIEALEQ
jgi:para-aminobenzoate synthetase component 1